MTLLRSYMMETDLQMCVLICLDVYLGLQEIKVVTNKQKIAESLGMPQHNNNVPKLAFWNLGSQIGYFLLIVDRMLVLETNINI